MKSQAIGSGVEKPPFLWWSKNKDGTLVSPYSGEAGPRTKWLGEKRDLLGNPTFSEGVDSHVFLNQANGNLPANLIGLMEGLATACVFQRVNSLIELQQKTDVQFWTQSPNSQHNSSVHHQA